MTGSIDLPDGALTLAGDTAAVNVSSGVLVVGTLALDGNASLAADLSSAPQVPASSTSYSYYSDGQLSSLAYPYAPAGDKATVNDSYDATGALSGLTDFAGGRIGFSHDADANTTAAVYPGGASAAYSYDLAGSMTSAVATSPTGTVLAGQGYNLDPAGRVVSETGTGGAQHFSLLWLRRRRPLGKRHRREHRGLQ